MKQSVLSAEFIDSAAGRILVTLRKPQNGNGRCVLIVPPFAEEMNKCRRQFTETALALNAKGYTVALPDLYGTGDSEGDFVDARWDTWCSDIRVTIDWLTGQGLAVDSAIAVRLGCLLLFSSLIGASTPKPARLMLWQPVPGGAQFLGQFLRLRTAASMMEAGKPETAEALRERLRQDEQLEIAGYTVSASLWAAIESLSLPVGNSNGFERIAVADVSTTSREGLSPVMQKTIDNLEPAAESIEGFRLAGEPFWSTAEIVTNPELLERSVAWLSTT